MPWQQPGVAAPEVTTEKTVIDQDDDDGTDRLVIKRADGTEMAEVYSNGTHTVIDPLTGEINIPGKIDTQQLETSSTVSFNSRFYLTGALWTDLKFADARIIKNSTQDVRNISSPSEGWTAVHDGSGTNTAGPAWYNGADWVSVVDGTTIS